MTVPLEYHASVRHSIPASLALFSLFALPVISVSTVQAQSNKATTASATSTASAPAHNSSPMSTASLAESSHPRKPVTPSKPTAPPTNGGQHHHYIGYTPPSVYLVAVPYAIDIGATDDGDATQSGDDSDANYQGGPTVFDRRGSGEDSYVPPVDPVPTPHSGEDAEASPYSPEPPQAPTLLIFKDGHTVELENYAIVGAILFDLTPGHARKIALADLDLEATRKHNDDRGISFQLPPPPQAN
jgi:hypothetical protein